VYHGRERRTAHDKESDDMTVSITVYSNVG
jgi:hypothetical protein